MQKKNNRNDIFYAIEPAGRGRKWWWDNSINNLFIHSQFTFLMWLRLIYYKTEGYFGFVLIKVMRVTAEDFAETTGNVSIVSPEEAQSSKQS